MKSENFIALLIIMVIVYLAGAYIKLDLGYVFNIKSQESRLFFTWLYSVSVLVLFGLQQVFKD
jgi:hypothetical protein